MNKTLSDINLINLMPMSMRQDQDVIDICNTVDFEFKEIIELIKLSNIYGRIDELSQEILEALAWENKMLGPEWAIAKDLETRRELVKNSFLLNKMRGTRWAVERVFRILGIQAEIKEWFEEGAAPFTFRISLLDVTGIGFNEQVEEWATSLIYAYKPVTRHITGTTIKVKSSVTDTRAAVATKFKIKFKNEV